MRIRLRVLLLALCTVVSAGAAVFVEYRWVEKDLNELQTVIRTIDRARLASLVIHTLQKERGLSAIHMIRPNDASLRDLKRQYAETDEVLNSAHEQKADATPMIEWLAEFHGGLAAIRENVLSDSAGWRRARSFYSEAISRLLDANILRTPRIRRSVGDRIADAVMALALAREKLGLIRATVSRIYSMNAVTPADIRDVIGYYGAFTEHKRALTRDFPETDRERFLTAMFPDDYTAVIRRVEEILGLRTVPAQDRQAGVWWEQATRVIDAMKAVEDEVLDSLVVEYGENLKRERAELRKYLIVATVLAAVVVALAMFTTARILRAMGVLAATLNRVMSSQDFGARIPLTSHVDEFGEIGLSINDLLSYTDTLIKEKDFLANTDVLTGVYNRRCFQANAESEFDRIRRYGGGLGLAMCDIDHFKAVNDTHGHDAGDTVLRRFADLIKGQMRKSDVFGRWGGEEFIVLAPQTEAGNLVTLAEKLRLERRANRVSRIGDSLVE